VLSDLPLRLPWQNSARDIGYITACLQEALGSELLSRSHLQVANELFYRNKAAWLVGKLVTPMATLPFLLPIHRTDEGELFVDACLTTHAEASIVFGFARSYFMVYAPLPGALVEWLREILPGKPPLNCTWRLAARSMRKPRAIGNTCTIFPAAMSNLLKRRGFAAW
jgi:isocitrate dehydrogenase kinase/phosphatase